MDSRHEDCAVEVAAPHALSVGFFLGPLTLHPIEERISKSTYQYGKEAADDHGGPSGGAPG